MQRVWLLVGFLCLFLTLPVAAQEQEYIVRLEEPPVVLFSNEEFPLTPLVPEENLYTVTESQLALVQQMPGLVHVEPAQKLILAEAPDDPLFYEQWNLSMVNMPDAWRWRLTGKGVRVGVIDSGAMADHPDLKNRVVYKYNYTTVGETDDVTDNDRHGTSVCGIIAAETENALGVAGMSGADLVVLKVVNNDLGYTSDLVRAIYGAVQNYDCDVINMSLGFVGESPEVQAAVNFALSKGVIVVSAVGNTTDGNGNAIHYPAGYDQVIGVAGVDSSKVHVSTSVVNESVDICAPGKLVYTTLNNGSWGAVYSSGTKVTGTSFAAPHVAGAAAVLKGIDPDLTSAEFQSLIENTSVDLGAKGYDTSYGFGLMDVKALTETVCRRQKLKQFSRVFENESGEYYVDFRNLSGGAVTGTLLFGSYLQDGTLTGISPGLTLTVDDGDTDRLVFGTGAAHDYVRVMLFENLNALSPVCAFGHN
ncbi:MAG: S8 family serine peptidase [Clostridia bacterium]|nr:S8 family serine peptidase [Clostridia bacterium]